MTELDPSETCHELCASTQWQSQGVSVHCLPPTSGCVRWCSQAPLTEAPEWEGYKKCQALYGCPINRAAVTVTRQSFPVSFLPVSSIPQASQNAGLSDSLGTRLSSLSLSLTASQGLPRGSWNHFPNPGFFMAAITVNADTWDAEGSVIHHGSPRALEKWLS